MDLLKQLAEDLRLGEDEAVRAGTESALAAGLAPVDVLKEGLLAGMAVVGEEFGRREIFLPDVLLAARAMQAGMEVLKPHLARDGAPPAGRVVLGTVQGDLHDIGKNLVGILLRGAGWEVIDLGTDVPAPRFVEAAERSGARVIGLSALLTTTMPRMGEVVSLLRERGLSGRVKVIVGGAPVTQAFADEIGADGWGFDADSAVRRVTALVGSA
ncbi:MAG: corrinoid protein [Thermoanaerobaculia bacterium]|nr:corrinoid protein [Thermoanaerobaculia bacterium]